MVGSAAVGVERKSSLGNLAHEQFVAPLQLIELRCEVAVRYELEEKLHFVFIWRRDDGIGSLRPLLRSLHTQGGVLPWRELEFSAGIYTNHPEVRGKINPLCNSWAIKLIVGSAHKDLPKNAGIFEICQLTGVEGEIGW
jgi:hypothetical protein